MPVTIRTTQPILVFAAGSAAAQPSQYMMERAIAHHDLDCRYFTVEVAPDRFAEALNGMRAMGFCGGHIGDVHQRSAVELLDEVDSSARVVGAVDCFTRQDQSLLGSNTLGPAVVNVVRRHLDPAGKKAVVIGLGRAGRAAALSWAKAGGTSLVLVNRTATLAEQFAAVLAQHYPACSTTTFMADGPPVSLDDADLLIRALPAGVNEKWEADLIAGRSLRPGVVVLDLSIGPPGRILAEAVATAHGQLVEGLDVFVERHAIALGRWCGIDPDRRVMREAAEEFLMEV